MYVLCVCTYILYVICVTLILSSFIPLKAVHQCIPVCDAPLVCVYACTLNTVMEFIQADMTNEYLLVPTVYWIQWVGVCLSAAYLSKHNCMYVHAYIQYVNRKRSSNRKLSSFQCSVDTTLKLMFLFVERLIDPSV